MASTSRVLTAPDVVETAPGDRLRVQLVRGALELRTLPTPGVRVELLEIEGAPLEVATEDHEIRVGYPSIGWDGWLRRLATSDATDRAVLRVAVGAGTRVIVAGVSAETTIEGLTEDVEVVTASGTVHARATRGSLEVRTASGDVTATDHAGPVSVVGVSGDVRLEGELPRTSVTTVSGDVRAEHGGTGAILTTTTVSGATTVRLLAGSEVDLEVRSVSGAVTLDGADRRSGAITRHHEPGAGHRATIRATTVSGAVDVTRADQAQLPEGSPSEGAG